MKNKKREITHPNLSIKISLIDKKTNTTISFEEYFRIERLLRWKLPLRNLVKKLLREGDLL